VSGDDESNWMFFKEHEDYRNAAYWRGILEQRGRPENALHVRALDDGTVYYLVKRLSQAREEYRSERDYKSFLRAVGGAGDSDWYATKAKMDAAGFSEEMLVNSIEPLAQGAGGTIRESCDQWLAALRAEYEASPHAGGEAGGDR